MNKLIPLALLLCACPGKVKESVHVEALDGYERATKSAIKQINGYVGCPFLLMGGDESHPDITVRGGHDHESPWDATPNINTKACIAAHTIGHGLGLEHDPGPDPIGIMATCKDPATDEQNAIRVRDADVARLRLRFCR